MNTHGLRVDHSRGRLSFLLFSIALFSLVASAWPAAAVAATCYQDGDGDGFGNASVSQIVGGSTCPAGWSLLGTDCDDTRAAIHPGATEICNGLNDNCVNGVDESNVCYTVYYCDADGDGYIGLSISASCTTYQCVPDDCATTPGDDCNDRNRAIHPGATEICNNLDDNCVGGIDENGVCYLDYYCDGDHDGYFSAVPSGNCNAYQCLPAGCQSATGDDCNDALSAVHPGATEVCNGIDDNCAAGIDENGDALCDDGAYCNGAETCGGAAGCQAGEMPCGDDNPCTADSCDEAGDECVYDPAPFNGDTCDDGFWCTDHDICRNGECAGLQKDCDDGIPCSVDTCDETARQCANDTDVCAAITVAPDCGAAEFDRWITVPVTIGEVNGENDLGFTLTYDPALLKVVGYTLQGGVLENWRETFECVEGAAGEAVCAGLSDHPLDRASAATLVKFFLAPQAEPPAAVPILPAESAVAVFAADRALATLAVIDLQADLQYMSVDECTLETGDDDDDDTADDDTADDDTADDDTAPADDDTTGDDSDDDTPPGDDDTAPTDDDKNFGDENSVDSGGC